VLGQVRRQQRHSPEVMRNQMHPMKRMSDSPAVAQRMILKYRLVLVVCSVAVVLRPLASWMAITSAPLASSQMATKRVRNLRECERKGQLSSKHGAHSVSADTHVLFWSSWVGLATELSFLIGWSAFLTVDLKVASRSSLVRWCSSM